MTRPTRPWIASSLQVAGDLAKVRALQQLRARLDPFALAEAIDRKLGRIYRLANRRHSPRPGRTRRWTTNAWFFPPVATPRLAAEALVRT